MTEMLMARTREVPSDTVPIERINSQLARAILQKLGIKGIYGYWGYDDRGTVTLVNFDGFPWEAAALNLSNAEGIVRCLGQDGCGLPFSAEITQGEYKLEIVPPSVYRRSLKDILPKLPEPIKARINDALQKESNYRKPFVGLI